MAVVSFSRRCSKAVVLLAVGWLAAAEMASSASADPSPPALDVVGVKLGMSPKEVRAAVQAFNPTLTVETISARLQDPTTNAGKYERFPHFLVAHTVNKFNPEYANLPDGTVESIGVEFTMPPGSPVADRIIRRVQFPNGKPVLASTLIQALEKKYGPSNAVLSGDKVWVFGTDGKLLPQGLPQSASQCMPSGAFPVEEAGSQGRDIGDVSLQTTADPVNARDDAQPCAQFLFVKARELAGVRLDQPMHRFELFIESGPLYVKSRVATHQWLQAAASSHDKNKAAVDAAREAPAL